MLFERLPRATRCLKLCSEAWKNWKETLDGSKITQCGGHVIGGSFIVIRLTAQRVSKTFTHVAPAAYTPPQTCHLNLAAGPRDHCRVFCTHNSLSISTIPCALLITVPKESYLQRQNGTHRYRVSNSSLQNFVWIGQRWVQGCPRESFWMRNPVCVQVERALF